jgi:hypothetical protein
MSPKPVPDGHKLINGQRNDLAQIAPFQFELPTLLLFYEI